MKDVPTVPFSGLVLSSFNSPSEAAEGATAGPVGAEGIATGAGAGEAVFDGSVAGPVQDITNRPRQAKQSFAHAGARIAFVIMEPLSTDLQNYGLEGEQRLSPPSNAGIVDEKSLVYGQP
ncbi:MAG: hypothetical protein Q8P00_02455 [Dehalococcoidia bacterium]|nr:hypothetical protein [Dehalococcoidia bacterium]